MKSLKTEGVILDTTPIFDADRSLLLFTYEAGKMRARARGVRKTTTRLTGHLVPFVPIQFELVQGNSGYIVTQASLVGGAHAVYPKEAVRFLGCASIVAEVVQRLFVDGEAHPPIYSGLVYTLDLLATHAANEAVSLLVVVEFIMKVLVELGYAPELTACVGTGEALDPADVYWSNSSGGTLSGTASKEVADGQKLQSQTVVLLRQLAKPVFVSERVTAGGEVVMEAAEVVFGYVQYQLGQPLSSLPSIMGAR